MIKGAHARVGLFFLLRSITTTIYTALLLLLDLAIGGHEVGWEIYAAVVGMRRAGDNSFKGATLTWNKMTRNWSSKLEAP